MISTHAWWMNIRQAVSPGQGGRFGEESLQEVPLHTNAFSLTDERHGRHPVLHTSPPLMQAAIGSAEAMSDPDLPQRGWTDEEVENKKDEETD